MKSKLLKASELVGRMNHEKEELRKTITRLEKLNEEYEQFIRELAEDGQTDFLEKFMNEVDEVYRGLKSDQDDQMVMIHLIMKNSIEIIKKREMTDDEIKKYFY
jgi:hypothetical protein